MYENSRSYFDVVKRSNATDVDVERQAPTIAIMVITGMARDFVRVTAAARWCVGKWAARAIMAELMGFCRRPNEPVVFSPDSEAIGVLTSQWIAKL